MSFISQRATQIAPSATIAISDKAAQMKLNGRKVISLGAGEPDFDTPDFIKDAAIEAIQKGQTKYTAVDGTAELKDAIITKFKRDQGFQFERNQILVSSGAKHSLFNLFQATLNPEDEVIIPVPAWVSYMDMVKLCDGVPVTVNTSIEQHFKITPAQLAKAITPKTKLFILNSPSNPTGMAYSQEELVALGNVLQAHPNILTLCDDIYEHIYWGEEPFTSFITANPQLANHSVIINGVSKAYAMTGWRIGYSAGPAEVIKTMKKLQSQNTSCPCAISQAAATAALTADQSFLRPMVETFKARHDLTYQALNQMKDVSCLPAQGAFYAFIDVRKAMANLSFTDDLSLSSYILEHAEVATVPGTAFGTPGHLRLSFATSNENLLEAFKRLTHIFEGK